MSRFVGAVLVISGLFAFIFGMAGVMSPLIPCIGRAILSFFVGMSGAEIGIGLGMIREEDE